MQRHLRRMSWPRVAPGMLLLAVAAGATPFGAALTEKVRAQEAPPAIRLTTIATRNFTDAPRQYDLVQTLLDLAPGAAVHSHRIGGRALITVISGEVTRVEEGGESAVYVAGQTFAESSEDHFDVDINNGNGPARLLATFLLPPGGEPLLLDPNPPPSDAPAPTFVAVSRTTVGKIPADFTLVHGIFEVPPGWVGGLHTHDGWSTVTELSGGHVTNRVNGIVQTGATFVHGPLDVHEGEHTGSQAVIAMFASAGPTGAPPSRPVAQAGIQTATQTESIQPPSTGDAGLAEGR